jgi:hypothetical protein
MHAKFVLENLKEDSIKGNLKESMGCWIHIAWDRDKWEGDL